MNNPRREPPGRMMLTLGLLTSGITVCLLIIVLVG